MWTISRKCVFYSIFKNTTKHQKIFSETFFEMQPNTWKHFLFRKIAFPKNIYFSEILLHEPNAASVSFWVIWQLARMRALVMTLQTEMSSPCYLYLLCIYMKVEALALAKLRDCLRVFQRKFFFFLSCFLDLREMALAPKAKEIIVSTTFLSSSPLNLMTILCSITVRESHSHWRHLLESLRHKYDTVKKHRTQLSQVMFPTKK